MATHANGISARQLWRQLGLGSYKSAWLLARKLRRAMVDPERERLAGLVEVDEASVPFRAQGDAGRPRRARGGSAPPPPGRRTATPAPPARARSKAGAGAGPGWL